MTLNIEKEVDTELGFDYEKVIRDVVEAALEFEECPYEIELNVILTSNEEIADDQQGLQRFVRADRCFNHFR